MAVKAKKGSKEKKGQKAKKVAKVAKKASPGKPARPGGTHVDFGVHGFGKIMSAVHSAGLDKELNDHLKDAGQFVKVSRKSLIAIKDFVDQRPQLAKLAEEIAQCDCPAWDPGCVYIPG